MSPVRFLAIALLLTAGCATRDVSVPPEPRDPPSMAHSLIQDLAHEDPEVRERAAAELEAMGRAAVPELKAALASTDPEVAQRARSLLDRLPTEFRRLYREEHIERCAFSPDGGRVACHALRRRQLLLLESATGKALWSMAFPEGKEGPAWRGPEILLSTRDQRMVAFRADTGEQRVEEMRRVGGPDRFQVNDRGDVLFGNGRTATWVWPAGSKGAYELPGVFPTLLYPDGTGAAGISRFDGRTQILHFASGSWRIVSISQVPFPGGPAVAVPQAGLFAASEQSGGTVATFRADGSRATGPVDCGPGKILCLAPDPDGRFLLVGRDLSTAMAPVAASEVVVLRLPELAVVARVPTSAPARSVCATRDLGFVAVVTVLGDLEVYGRID